jgi:hypothetical protein
MAIVLARSRLQAASSFFRERPDAWPSTLGSTMANEGQSRKNGLEVIADALKTASRRSPPPVHLWDPAYCGEIDIRIAADGTWFYQGTPIGRHALVKLFASILKREGQKYFLVTPVEKCGIVVDDAPFTAIEMRIEDDATVRRLCFRTNVDDWVTCGADHPLRFETETATGGLKPYIHVRRDLWAKVARTLFYDLVSLGETREIAGTLMFGVASASQFYAMAPASSLEDITR